MSRRKKYDAEFQIQHVFVNGDHGSDSNDGLTSETPVRAIQESMYSNTVVGVLAHPCNMKPGDET